MAESLFAINCPHCGAELQTVNRKNGLRCSYCGEKVFYNGSDEILTQLEEDTRSARETNQRVKEIAQLKAENQDLKRLLEIEKKKNKSNNKANAVWALLTMAFVFIPLLGDEEMGALRGFALLIGLASFIIGGIIMIVRFVLRK